MIICSISLDVPWRFRPNKYFEENRVPSTSYSISLDLTWKIFILEMISFSLGQVFSRSWTFSNPDPDFKQDPRIPDPIKLTLAWMGIFEKH